MAKLCLISLFCFYWCCFVKSEDVSIASEIRLRMNLMSDLYKHVRPVKTIGESVKVQFRLSLIAIYHDDSKEILKTRLWIKLSWKDAQLQWDPEEYGGINSLPMKPSHIWLPDILLYNSMEGDGSVLAGTNVDAIVKSDGSVHLYVPKTVASSCNLKTLFTNKYSASCVLMFGSWVHSSKTLDLQLGSPMVDLSSYTAPGSARVNSTTLMKIDTLYACCPDSYTTIKATLSIVPQF